MSLDFNDKFDLTMVVTYQNQNQIQNFLTTIKRNSNIKLFVVLINQETAFKLNKNDFNNSFITIDIKKIGLSKARNIGIEYLKENCIKSEYIMFPDDDSTFDDSFFLNFSKIISTKKNYLTPIYIEGTKNLYLGKKFEEGKQVNENNHSLIGSPNQIINFERNKKYIFFDEQLGVGTELGSCEDYDLFVRLCRNGNPYYFTSKLYSYHPPKINAYKGKTLNFILQRFKSYSKGFCFIIYKYQKFRFIPNYLFRSFIASVYYLIKLDFKLFLAYLVQFLLRLMLIIRFTFQRV